MDVNVLAPAIVGKTGNPPDPTPVQVPSSVSFGVMKSQAYLIIGAAASNPNDVARLGNAFDLVWQRLADRIGGHEEAREEVAERLARLIVNTGNRRAEISAEELARIVGRTFEAPVDQARNEN